MASNRLKIIFAVSIPIFMLHGLEELTTGFYDVDPHHLFLFGPFNRMPVAKATWVVSILMIWAWMITSLLLVIDPKWQLRLAIIPGLLYLFELHHFLDVTAARGYTPGAITGVAFPVLAFFFWRQWLKDWAARNARRGSRA